MTGAHDIKPCQETFTALSHGSEEKLVFACFNRRTAAERRRRRPASRETLIKAVLPGVCRTDARGLKAERTRARAQTRPEVPGRRHAGPGLAELVSVSLEAERPHPAGFERLQAGRRTRFEALQGRMKPTWCSHPRTRPIRLPLRKTRAKTTWRPKSTRQALLRLCATTRHDACAAATLEALLERQAFSTAARIRVQTKWRWTARRSLHCLTAG